MQKKLFKTNSSDKIQFWEIEVDLESGRFRTHSGLCGGKVKTSKWTQCEAKNIGKSNETTPKEQAQLEADAKIQKQLDKGYAKTKEEAREKENLAEQAMLAPAKKFHEMQGHVFSLGEVFCQPKLDGIRCIARRDGLFSRNGKPIVATPHIESEVKKILALNPHIEFLDGELYNHRFADDFNKITSIVKKTKPTKEALDFSRENISLHVYDACTTTPTEAFCSRFDRLPEFDGQIIVKVLTKRVSAKEKELSDIHDEFIREGYEGTMIRKVEGKYEKGRRSKGLIKRKNFVDEEYIITGVVEGRGNKSGLAAAVWCKTPEGKCFKAQTEGSEEFRRELLKNADQIIGKMGTVKREGRLTPDGIPRFPYLKAIRDYE